LGRTGRSMAAELAWPQIVSSSSGIRKLEQGVHVGLFQELRPKCRTFSGTVARVFINSDSARWESFEDQFSEPEALVEFAHQDQAAIGSDAGTLEINLERGVEGELQGLVGISRIIKGRPLGVRFEWFLTSPRKERRR